MNRMTDGLLPGMRRINNIHFIGIGGSGMCGIAEVIINLGYQVSGSDLRTTAAIERLHALGARIYIGQKAQQVEGAEVVVVSSAIVADNPEYAAARFLGIPIVQRAEMLAELMRFRHGIAVAGTHGKTTTTSLVASIFAQGQLDPTFVIGGKLTQAGTSAQLGQGRYLIAEADESDASFLHLQPLTAIVTNIDADHMSTYGGDFHQLKKAFVDFLHNLPFYGLGVLCIDDEHVRALIPQLQRPKLTYGFSDDADFQAQSLTFAGMYSEFRVKRPCPHQPLNVRLHMPGKHNVLNALAAIAIATDEGVSDDAITQALLEFQGVGRRFQVRGRFPVNKTDPNAVQSGAVQPAAGRSLESEPAEDIMLVDDYGHHPKEIEVTLAAIRHGWPKRRLVMVFQPHRYSRTRDLYDDFVTVLNEADVLVLLEVYSAGEEPIAGADTRSLSRSIRQRGHVDPIFVAKQEDLYQVLEDLLQSGDLLLLQGAGNIGLIAAHMQERLPYMLLS